jgi:hypothetical protein
MSNKIRVTWQNPDFLEKTYNKGKDGLGDSYTPDQYQIVFTTEELNRLLTEFNVTISQWSGLDSNGISEYFRESGESLSGAMVRELKRRLNRILFYDKLTNVYTYFPFSDKNATSQSKTNVMKYMLDILQSYRDITQRILNKESGLAEDAEYSPPSDAERLNLIDVSGTETTNQININLKISKLQIPLLDSLISATTNLLTQKSVAFFDESREYKTILNLGNDRQFLAQAWRVSPTKPNAIQVKLFSPLSNEIQLYDFAFVSRELAKSVIDIVEFALGPQVDNTPYLRPRNIDLRKHIPNKKKVTNVTLNSLGMGTGSSGTIVNSTVSYDDVAFRRWFTSDFKSSELNIEFTDYSKFVTFGSAYNRLNAFSQKLLKIEQLTVEATASVSSSTVGASLKALEKENIIRNFDPYEQFLYFATESTAYSSSAFYVEGEVEYNPTGSWPKMIDGTLYSPTSSITASWLPTQLAIAQRYDDNNPNYLTKHLPQHIQDDTNSTDFLTLISMFGHMVDNVKVYIDQFSNIYSTSPNPYEELTMDQVYEVAQSFGLQLPNAYSLENLQTFISSISGESGSRSLVAETWKRFLHSSVYLSKTKGSRTSFDALLNTYGLNSPILQIKETTYPTTGNYIKSDELTYGLSFTGSSANLIKVPFVSSSITASTVQFRFIPELRQSSSIVTGDLKWAIDVVPHPSASDVLYLDTGSTGALRIINGINKVNYGKIQVVSGSNRTVIATSSYFPLFSDDYTSIMLRSQSGDLTILQTDGDQILYQESMSVNLSSLWNSTQFIYVGGSGSIRLNKFDGIVDEVRVWGENISADDFVSQTYDPGSYYGTDYTSSYANLYAHIAFSQPLSSITQSVVNESPYQNLSIVATFPATGFTTASFARLARPVKQFTPVVGSTIYTNKKVVVASPPSFDFRFVDENGTRTLKKDVSIKSVEEKIYTSGQNVVSVAVSPTDFTNQTILRSMGVIDVNNTIGTPRNIEALNYSNLTQLERYFKQYYNKTVNPNEYTRFFKDLVQSPSEMAEEMVPARAKLLNGIVIESPILHRNKTFLMKTIKVDGTNTKELDLYRLGSGSEDVGAYPFTSSINTRTYSTFEADTLLVSGTLDTKLEIYAVSSSKKASLPSTRQVIQYVGVSLVSSSLQDENSSFLYVEADSISGAPTEEPTSPYPRNPYFGIPGSSSVASRLPSEDGTLTPIYDIPPRSDFSDVGTTTYFHKSNGKYSYDIYTSYKKEYLVKLDTQTDSPLDRLYAPITLLDKNSLLTSPGRDTGTIVSTTYSSGSYSSGIIKVANIFTILGIEGATGLRLRLYRDEGSRATDVTRSFSTAPSLNSGVLFDAVLDGNPDVFPYTLVQTNNSDIYYSIDNTTSSTIVSEINIYYFAYEPANLIPTGYLPRHYKFSRENNTALKRRNYLGTKGTDSDVPAGCPWSPCPPFKVAPSGEYTIVVNQAASNARLPETNNITFGGGGTLDVKQ